MKLLLLGATGGTGRELLAGALSEGHELTALVRNPSRMTLHDERLRVLAGNATDPIAVEKAVAGNDAVLCALGPSSPSELIRSNLMGASGPALVSSMERSGVGRL